MPSMERLRVPLFLALSEMRPGFGAADVDEIQRWLPRADGLPFEVVDVQVLADGHAAGLAALAAAAAAVRENGFEACLVGGVDSYLHADTIEWLESNRQLACAISRSAFVPGEAAGFCLLMSDKACARRGLRPLARVAAAAVGRETRLIKSRDVCLGNGLTAVVRSALSQLPSSRERINTVICDINGERYRAEEWAFVCLRLGQFFDDPTAYWSPADSWGDVGAASGPLFTMLACEAAVRGYISGPRTLVWASSEGGLRAAAILEAAGSN
jgi:3-oxoacyl-[acyl-carrier-protein] synthase-1